VTKDSIPFNVLCKMRRLMKQHVLKFFLCSKKGAGVELNGRALVGMHEAVYLIFSTKKSTKKKKLAVWP
jgi:hypothetical protein